MARLKTTIPVNELRKMAGKLMVIKQYKHIVVVTKYPDMSKVKPTQKQKEKRRKFSEAVAFAQSILKDEALKKAYLQKLSGKQTVYHFALKEYLLLST